MASVRVRKKTDTLFLDFYFKGHRCREQTALKNTPANRKKVETLAQRIEAKILLGEFDYAEFFPASKNAERFSVPASATLSRTAQLNSAASSSNGQAVAVPFEEYARRWFELKKVEWRESHAKNVLAVLESSLIRYFKRSDLQKITKVEILEFRSELSCMKGRGRACLSPKTINNHMQLLRAILRDAADDYDFVSAFRNIKPLKVQKSHVVPFSLAEVELILKTVRKDYRNYYVLRFYTGMRTGEIDGLQWRYVDFERRQILIRETLVEGRREYTKTDGSQREIDMIGPVYEALKAQYECTYGISDYVFCNREGKPLDHNNVSKRVWLPLLRHLGLEPRRQYQTRHTAATLMLSCGESAEWVAYTLGHASTEMLFKVYSRYIPNATHNDGSQFEKLIHAQQGAQQ